MLRSVLVLACLVIALPLLPGAASAQEEELSAIRELIFQARFEAAVQQANALLERSDLEAAERNAALEVLATAQLANRQDGPASETLRLLYSRDPGHRLTDPDASPPVISAFARAREAAPTPITVSLQHEPPALTRREPPSIEVRVAEGADAIAELRLVYRIAGEGEPPPPEASPQGQGVRGDLHVVIRVKEAALLRALDNLLSNALRYGKPPVVLGARISNAGFTIDVRDAGPGISPEMVSELLRPFTRGNVARAGEGTGLGLAIVEQVARVHGGDVTFEQTAEMFTARLHLPQAAEAS